MKIIWNKVTRLSQLVAIVLFVLVFALGIYIGKEMGILKALGPKINNVWFECDEGKNIHAIIYKHSVFIKLSGGEKEFLSQTISASGVRYANDDESLVFWSKGDSAFVTQGDLNNPTYSNCVLRK